MIKLGDKEVEGRYITDSNGVPHEVVAAYIGDNLVYNAKIEEANAEFYYRKTGGTQSVGSGIAAIKEIRGKSIVWNQKFNDTQKSITKYGIVLDYSQGQVSCHGTSTNAIYHSIISFTHNHKYYLHFKASAYYDEDNLSYWTWYNTPTMPFQLTAERELVFTAQAVDSYMSILTDGNNAFKSGKSVDVTAYIQAIDLTLMFGAGNEPATVAAFKKMFPLDYYGYNIGEVIPFAGQNLTTTGKNQYNPATGKANLLGGQQYQITGTYTKLYPTVTLIDYTYGNVVTMGTYYTNDNNRFVGTKTVVTYDNTKTYGLGKYCTYNNTIYKSNVAITTAEEFDATHWDVIADVAAMVSEGIFTTLADITPDTNGLFTLTKDTEVTIVGGNDTDTMIAIYTGESIAYEPYEKHTLPLDPSQWRDKQGNLVFPYGGMHGVGNVYDYAKVDADGYIRKAVRRFEKVDLGTKNWGYNSTRLYFYTLVSDMVNNEYGGIMCSKYIVVGGTSIYNNAQLQNKKIGTNYLIGSAAGVTVSDQDYTDATTFKTAMQGVQLVYKLATPVEVELATPIYAKYLVDKDGTEEITPANGTTPYTTMANLHLVYPKK